MNTVLLVLGIETVLAVLSSMAAAYWARHYTDKPTRAQRKLARSATVRPGDDLIEPRMLGQGGR